VEAGKRQHFPQLGCSRCAEIEPPSPPPPRKLNWKFQILFFHGKGKKNWKMEVLFPFTDLFLGIEN